MLQMKCPILRMLIPLERQQEGNLNSPARGRSLTDWKGVHPAPPVGRQLHGHPGRCEWVDEGPLGGVTSRTDVQGGLSAAHREPARSAGVPLGVHHLLQKL